MGVQGAIVQDLPRNAQVVLALVYSESCTLEEVASILGCHVGTSKSQLHKARGKLREILLEAGITAAELEGR